MATTSHAIDISQNSELRRLVDELRASGRSVILRQGSEPVAVLTALDPAGTYPWREPTEENYAAFRSAAGSWHGHIDAERFLKENYEQRRISSRPPTNLPNL